LQDQWEKTKADHERLSLQLSELKCERDDLASRINIAQQTNRQLSARLSEEKRSSSAQREAAVAAYAQELDAVKAQSKSQVDAVSVKLQDLQELFDQEQVKRKLAESATERVLAAAEIYFEERFGSATDLIRKFEEPAGFERQVQEQEVSEQKQRTGKLVRRLKARRRENEREIAGLQRTVGDLERELEKSRENAEGEKVQLEKQIAALEEGRRVADTKHRNVVAQLQAKVAGLSSDLGTALANLRAIENTPRTSTSRGQQCEHAVDTADRVTELQSELRVSQAQRGELADKLKESEANVYRLACEVERRKGENESLESAHKETVAQVQALRAKLLEKTGTEALRTEEKTSKRITKLQKKAEEQAQKIATLEAVLARRQGEIQDQERLVRTLRDEKTQLERENDVARNDARALQLRLLGAEVSPDSVLPADSFQLAGADLVLANSIAKIGENPGLQPGSKLQAAMRTIKRYYEKLIESKNAALEEALSDNQGLSAAFDQFLIDVSIAGTNQPLRLATFLAGDAGKVLVSQITALRASVAELRRNADSQTAILRLFSETFQGKYDDRYDLARHITQVKTFLDRLTTKYSVRGQKIRGLQSKLEAQKDNAARQSAERAELEKRLHKAIATVDQQRRDLAKAHAQIQTLANEQTEVHSTMEHIGDGILEQHREEIEALRASKSQIESSLGADVNRWKSAYEQLESDVTILREKLRTLQAAKERLEYEIDELRRDAAEREKPNATPMEAAYEQTVNDLRTQLANVRDDLMKVSALRDEAEKRAQAAALEVAAIDRDRRRVVAQKRSLKSQIERERKVAESSCQAAKSEVEASYFQKLEEQRAKAEAEKQGLLAIGIEAFRWLFDPNEPLSERTFKTIVTRANEELRRLEHTDRTIRKIVGASDRQTTADAVAQAVLHSQVSD
jgi:chromosome segregation ATPase